MFPYRRLPSHINGLYIFTITNFMVLCHITLVQGAISVISLKTNQTVLFDIRDMPARFGRDVERDMRGQIVYAEPANACVPIQSPPNSTAVSDLQWFVLIMRYGCNFSKKVLNAQVAGFQLAVVHNVGSDQLEPMGPDDDQEDVEIPSVFIGESDGLLIKNTYTYDKEYILQISPDFPFNLNTYLIPFAVGVGVCLVVMCLVLVFKCIRDRHHRQSHRLPSSLLKKLPIKKFKKEDHYDICAICLEDYVEGEKLRVLPCAHTYHLKCIDPWLTQRHRTCPVCKQKVFPGRNNRANDLPDPPSSDVFSDQEDDTNDSLVPNENTPLLNGTNINSLGDIFPTPRSHGSPFFQSGCDTSTDPGWPSSYRGSSQFASVNISPSSSMEDGSLTVPVLIPGGGDLLSSGEHSLNGDVMDFSPSENWLPDNSAQQQRIPVEGEVLLPPPPRRTPSAGSMLTSSMPSTSTPAQNQSPRQQGSPPPRAYSPRFLRNSRSKRKHSSSGDPDVVV